MHCTVSKDKIDILLVEDNLGDVFLIQEALEQITIPNNLHIVNDGEKALRFLKRDSANLPDLIYLDINIPLINGRELLRIIKSSPDLRDITVIVLTTSNTTEDIEYCYRTFANTFVTKPFDILDLDEVIQKTLKYWSIFITNTDSKTS